MSLLAGVGLTLAAARGSALRRLLLGTAGISLISRGATGFCAMKSAATGQSTLKQGFQEQWRRMRDGVSQVSSMEDMSSLRTMASATRSIDSMHALYVAELQELHSAEQQLRTLVDKLSGTVAYAALSDRLSHYANDLRSRTLEAENVLEKCGALPSKHPDQAMRALVNEAHKMTRVSGTNIRDAALVASLQRIIHYKIAGYGTIASYAKALGRIEEAASFASYAAQDKNIDAELTELAKSTLNPQAHLAPERGAPELRAH